MKKSATEKLNEEIVDKASSEPLSRLLPSTLTLARRLHNQNFENWVRLEMDGYLSENPAMNHDVMVPKYRTIAGQRSDELGRPLIINDPKLYFINEDRIRSGVAELEHLARSKDMLIVRDPTVNEKIRKELDVEVTKFTFHPSALAGVLSNIRSRLLDWLNEIQPDIKQIGSNSVNEDINSGDASNWRYTLFTSSILAILGSSIWFLSERTFEPLLGLLAGITGLAIYRQTSNKIVDSIVSLILIVLFITGLVMVILRL